MFCHIYVSKLDMSFSKGIKLFVAIKMLISKILYRVYLVLTQATGLAHSGVKVGYNRSKNSTKHTKYKQLL